MRAGDEAEVWADGYSFVEFQRTGTGLIPYHHESDSAGVTLPLAASGLLAEEDLASDGASFFTLLA